MLAPPSNFVATTETVAVSPNVYNVKIHLSWTDNSSNETGFEIESKVGAGGIYTQIAIVGAGVTSYTQDGYPPSTTYYLRVRAYNSNSYSSYSNEASVTTKAGQSSSGGGGGGGGGCFIATAAYGSQMEPHVKILREFRDGFLLNNSIGKAFVQLYYTYSPPIADFIAKHANLRAITRLSLLPIVGVSWVALKLGPFSTLAMTFFLIFGIMYFSLFRKKLKKD